MDFGNRERSLGAVDVGPLRDRILAQPPEAWTEFGLRQRTYDVHHDTESVVLVFCDEAWPDVTVSGGRLAMIVPEVIGRRFG